MFDWFTGSSCSEVYIAAFRAPLFTGFLTMTAFVFSVKAFLVINLYKDVYSEEGYQLWIVSAREVNPRLTFFGPLRRLMRVMMWTVAVCFGASVVQLTVGCIRQNWAAVFCLLCAAVAACLVAVNLFVWRSVVISWLEIWEENAEKKYSQSQPPTPSSSPPSRRQP